MAPSRQPRNRGDSFARQLMAFGNVGMMFPVSIGIGFAGGYYLDQWLSTTPWFALGGFALGVAAAFRHLLRSAASLERAEQEGDDPNLQERRQKPPHTRPPDPDE